MGLILPAAIPNTLSLEIPSVVLSTVGVLLIFSGFMGLMKKRFHPKSELYLALNAVGSVFLFSSLLIASLTGSLGAIPICLLQLPWGGTAAHKWWKVRRGVARKGGERSKLERLSLPDPNAAANVDV
ncbi:hypothetical protein TeGR_g3916 [Tetraparma gracilis]|uniref:CBU-0592-like domain-containing protein n=1 Tax=Tetraparma gracilis TaxID=2962635 RepID=A0ABQ6N1A6_9STRA|nr:hypothetical protein TeGR_g3916 [Tetraparma gracilis]